MASKRTTRGQAGKEECIINCLPRELIEHVFLGLPTSCLLECISVCKKWREIIRDSCFALAHIQHPAPCTLLFSPQGSSISGDLYPSDVVLFDEAWSPSKFAVPVIGPDDLICGSCNGLLCLHTPTSMIKIANLATGECIHLKKPTKNLKDDHFSFYRFGFYPATKDYKVIHFFQKSKPSTKGRFNVIQVYTLGDDRWKDVITPEALSLNCVKNSGAVIVDGTMYWLIEDRGASWQHAVMSFDIGEENFSQIQLPAIDFEDWALGGDARRHYWVEEINGKVCVSTGQRMSRILIGEMQIWSLNGDVHQRWSLLYNIQLSSLFARGLQIVHGNRIMIQTCYSNLYTYELPGKKNFDIDFSKAVKLLDLGPRGEDYIQFFSFVKSLVPLYVYVKAGIVHRPKWHWGWKLKKWKEWEHQLFTTENSWRRICQMEHELLEARQTAAMVMKKISQHFADDVIWQRTRAEIDQILQHLPDCPVQHPRPVRRLNWVEKVKDKEKFEARLQGLEDMFKASSPAMKEIFGKMRSYVQAYDERPI
ncbi:unnamed protein product [Urochloa decumbens]|uniref:F-box domain-containing protein n=1 Tax=Urochloa decumbens TaxID=240449 RepID=A0ABC9FTG3_9POAL